MTIQRDTQRNVHGATAGDRRASPGEAAGLSNKTSEACACCRCGSCQCVDCQCCNCSDCRCAA